MKSIFEEVYEKVQAAKEAYEAAGTEEGREAARQDYRMATDGLKSLGAEGFQIWRAYEEARECGNSHPDFSEVIWDCEVKAIADCMKANGIETFTLSSNWSSAVKTAWLFQKNGYRQQGLIEISRRYDEKVPAYVFSLN